MSNKNIITKDSTIVQVCLNVSRGKEVDNDLRKDAQEYIKTLASDLNPMNRYALAQIVGFIVNDKFNQRTQYVDMIADVKRVANGQKAPFKMQVGTVTALYQAKGSTAQRSMVGSKYVEIETDEISCDPAVEIEQLQNGQIDFSQMADDAVDAMENKYIEQIETVIKEYWDDLSTDWYASANGLTSSVDTLITNVSRLGSPAVLGDIAFIQKFFALSGFNGSIPDAIVEKFHQSGLVGNYRGAKLVQLVNPLTNDTDMTSTLLTKGYGYVVPAGASEKRPLKLVFEGDVQAFDELNIKSRIVEFPMYKKVGVGLASRRYGMGFYYDTSI